MSSHASITAIDIIAMLKNSSLDTILVEGDTDMQVIRRITELYGFVKADIQQCYGRENLINVYKQRHLLAHIKLIFMADKDKFLYLGTPTEFEDIIFTTGYSIENDLLHQSAIERLFEEPDKERLKLLIYNFSLWYAFQIHQIKNGNDVDISSSPYNVIFDYHPFELQEKFRIFEKDALSSKEIHKDITSNFSILIRGHSLMKLVVIIFSNRQSSKPKYKESQLMELAIAAFEPPHLKKLRERVISKFESLS